MSALEGFFIWAAAAFCFAALCLHLVTCALVAWRARTGEPLLAPPADGPPITLVRPVCGLEPFSEETLRSSFTLDYPVYELIFCVAKGNDPIVPLVERLIAEHPQVHARLIVGDERISANPKLNNMVKGWEGAAHDHIVFADSNVLMPRDYLQRLVAQWDAKAGLVCSPPVGSRPHGFFAELECAFLNTFQARWQVTADTVGYGFAQGKTLFYRRDILDAAGGIRALAAELAEDAATTKIVRAAGLKVRLVDAPFEQPLGARPFREVWNRQVRWARLRRATFPALYAGEFFASALSPMLVGALALAFIAPVALPAYAVLYLAIWYAGEAMLAASAGWYLTWRSPFAWLMRDALLIAIWAEGWRQARFTWRGNEMTPAASGAAK